MDNLSLSPYQFIYFTDDRDPTSTESTYVGYSGLIYFWWNTSSLDIFVCTNSNTNGSLQWEKIATTRNIASVIGSFGWNLNKQRSYSTRSSPAFNTNYSPSSTNDCFVMAVVNVTSTLVTPGTVLFQLNDSGSFVTRGEASVSGVAASSFQTISCIVPANYSYKLINSSGTASIISINELLL